MSEVGHSVLIGPPRLRLLRHAYLELEKGDRLQASEKAWDAAARAVSAVALARGWEYSRHEDLFAAALKLSAEFDDSEFAGGFVVAEKFRENAEYDFMEDFQYEDDRKIVQDFVARTLALME